MPENRSTSKATEAEVTQCVLLTPEQAARRLGIGRWKLYDLLRQGALPSIRIGSCRRVPVQAIDDFVSALLRDQSGSAA